MRFLRRSLIGLILLSATVGLAVLAGNTVYTALQARWADAGGAPPARERVFAVNVVPFVTGRETPVLTTFGEVRSSRTLELRASAAGEIVWLSENFEEGGAVVAGELLARIDDQDARGDLETARADLAEAEADLADARRQIALSQDELAAAGEQAALRERALSRQRDLLGRGVGTEAAVEDAELAVSAARQAVLSRRQALAQAQSRAEQAAATLERRRIALSEAERRLADTEIRARFDGVFSEVDVVEGRLVSVNERIGAIVDPTALEVAFRVSAQQYARLLGPGGALPEAEVEVVLDVLGTDMSATGRITRESAAVAAGQTGRLLFARLGAAPGFRPGDFVTIHVAEPPLSGVARLPATALGGTGTLLVLGPEDRLEEVPVALLRRQGDDVLVRATATDLEGREIVAERTPFLGAGIRVRPIRPEAGLAPEPEDEFVELDAERRARLVAFVEGNRSMPEAAKRRILAQLEAERVPLRVVARIESRMGG